MNNMEIRLVGSGGQGVILATIILADAAINAGLYTAQSQSYGPEARGGSSKAEVLISEKAIGFTKVQNPTFFMALSQAALDKFGKLVGRDCLVLVDSSLDVPDCMNLEHITKAPILDTAKNVVGKSLTANIVAVGAINKMLNLVSDEAIMEAVLDRIPKGTEELNKKALAEGAKLI